MRRAYPPQWNRSSRPPVAARSAERRALQLLDRLLEEVRPAALQYGEAQGVLPRPQPRGESGERAARSAGHRDRVRGPAQLPAQLRTALCGKGVAAALRYEAEGPEAVVQLGEDVGSARRR